MHVILWTVFALGLVFIAVLAAARYSRTIAPPLVMPPGESFPTTPMQRRVQWALVLGLPPMLAAGALVVWIGPTVYDADDAVRLLVTGLMVASLLVLAAPGLLVGVWSSRAGERLDERDRAILARAPAGQAAAIVVLLAVWTIALTESFRGEPGIPGVYLNLIFWSCLLVGQLASCVSILIGYRRA